MNIWEDHVIVTLLNELNTHLRKNTASTKKDVNLTAPRFVFVCGRKKEEGTETIRSITIDKLEKNMVSSEYGKESVAVLCIISEDLYVQDLAEDIFSFEKMLAQISHKIVIVAESPGSFCELGAFVMDKEFFSKTIVINEDNDDYKNSFITRGPIKLLEEKNEKSVILHNGQDGIKTNIEFQHRMSEIVNEELIIPPNSDSKHIKLKSLIYELANIVELFEPLGAYEIEMLYKRLKEFSSYTIDNTIDHKITNIKKVLFLMEKMNLVYKKKGCYYLNKKISCYNILFTISRKEYNDIRIKYLNRLDKYLPQRMMI